MSSMKKTGVTANTPKQILFGAGVFYKNLVYNETTKVWEGDILGATKGGGTLTITPNIVNIQPDGVPVKVKGLATKYGETCTVQVNLLELTPDIVKLAVLGTAGTDEGGCEKIISKANIAEGDYLQNFAFVGKHLDGRDIICRLPYALCNSGLPVTGSDGAESAISYTFEEYIEISDTEDMDKLGYELMFEKITA